jgi:SAM-dependent methyltransferase
MEYSTVAPNAFALAERPATAGRTRSIELVMGGIGDAIAATGVISALAARHGTIEVHGGGIAELLHLPNVIVRDSRKRLAKQVDADYTLAIEPQTGFTHFKQHLSFHFADQLGLPRVVRRPHLCTALSTNFVLQQLKLPHKGYIVVHRRAGWAPRVPAARDMELVIELLKQVAQLLVVEVGLTPNPDEVSAHTDLNLQNRTDLATLYHLLDGAALVFTLDSMVYHLAMDRRLTTRVLCWWGNMPPALRAYPGSFDFHNARCFECCRQPATVVPDHCFTGTHNCLTMDVDRLTPIVEDLFREFPSYLNQGDAKSFIEDVALEYCLGRGLDIGAGKHPLPGAIPVDQGGQTNAYDLRLYGDRSMDFVFSSHCLEHLDRWQEALVEWLRVLKPGGTLFLYLPHEKMTMWLPGSPWVGQDHRWIPTWQRVSDFLRHERLTVLGSDPGPDRAFGFWGAFVKP